MLVNVTRVPSVWTGLLSVDICLTPPDPSVFPPPLPLCLHLLSLFLSPISWCAAERHNYPLHLSRRDNGWPSPLGEIGSSNCEWCNECGIASVLGDTIRIDPLLTSTPTTSEAPPALKAQQPHHSHFASRTINPSLPSICIPTVPLLLTSSPLRILTHLTGLFFKCGAINLTGCDFSSPRVPSAMENLWDIRLWFPCLEKVIGINEIVW